MKNRDKVALIVGAGDGIGMAIMRKFAQEGLIVCGARRNGEKLTPLIEELNTKRLIAHAFSCDARKEDAVIDLFAHIEKEIGIIEVVIFNVGANVPMKLLETDTRKFYKIWEMACYAGFLTGREAARYMIKRQRGTILFSGATASVRGSAGFAAFASAKHGLRALAHSMARELGPQNIHVAHVIIDGAVDTLWIRQNHPDYETLKIKQGIIEPADLAENYVTLYKQPKTTWTLELDIRPWSEKF